MPATNMSALNIFTKRFYDFEEVRAAFFASLFRQTYAETLFWAKELIDSYATSHVIELLVLAYTLKFGEGRMEFINVLNPIATRKIWMELDIMKAVYLFTTIPAKYMNHKFVEYIESAPRPYNKADISKAWLGGRSSPEFDIAMHYLMEIADPDDESLEPLTLPKQLPRGPKEIFSLRGRARRFFGVRADDIYGSARRSFMPSSESTVAEINNAHMTYHKSPAWRGAPPPENAYSADDDVVIAWEEYNSSVYVDDIPDEWSRQDKEKSHGPGYGHEPSANLYLQSLGLPQLKEDYCIEYPTIFPYILFSDADVVNAYA
jgi:hypothetical protein